jgi:hypothetical protein
LNLSTKTEAAPGRACASRQNTKPESEKVRNCLSAYLPQGLPLPWPILKRAELMLLGDGVTYDGREVIELRLSSQQLAGAVRLRDDLYRVARPAADAIDTKIHVRHAFDRIDHVKHGESAAVAAVERRPSAAHPLI